eukprot:SAG31_NODE_1002_length_10448_cov_27.630399_9_plen_50_part_00
MYVYTGVRRYRHQSMLLPQVLNLNLNLPGSTILIIISIEYDLPERQACY